MPKLHQSSFVYFFFFFFYWINRRGTTKILTLVIVVLTLILNVRNSLRLGRKRSLQESSIIHSRLHIVVRVAVFVVFFIHSAQFPLDQMFFNQSASSRDSIRSEKNPAFEIGSESCKQNWMEIFRLHSFWIFFYAQLTLVNRIMLSFLIERLKKQKAPELRKNAREKVIYNLFRIETRWKCRCFWSRMKRGIQCLFW